MDADPTLVLAAVALLAAASLWPRADTDRRLAAAAGAAVLAAGLLHTWAWDSLQDDAYISFRYARNWVEGYGLVFNPGERVEGYSNFLFVVGLAAAHAIAGLDLVRSANALGLLFAAATLGLTGRFATELCAGRRSAGLAAALLLAGSGAFAGWGRSGLETTLFTFLVLLTVRAAARDSAWAGGLAGLAALTRPEGAALGLVVGAAVWLRTDGRRRAAALALAGFALPVVPWTIWRLAYYGYWLPNTVAAKWGMALDHQLGLGLAYLAGFATVHAALLGLAAATAATVLARGRHAALGRADLLLGVTAGGYTAFAVATGGDWMPAYRMLAPVLPLACVGLARLWHVGLGDGAFGPGSRRTAAALAGAACTTLWMGTWQPKMLPRTRELRSLVASEVRMGEWFRRRLPPGTLMATFASGAIPFHSRLPTLDLLGLTDEHIARRGQRLPRGGPGHIAQDYPYVVARRPAVVVFLHWDGLSPAPSWEIASAFARHYRPVPFHFTRVAGPLAYANLWIRKSEAPRLVPRLNDPKAGIRVVPLDEPGEAPAG